MSLKKALHKRIELYEGKTCPLSEIYDLAHYFGISTRNAPYKQATAERKLRPSESPNIKTVYNEKDYIIGYRLIKVEPSGQLVLA